MELNRSHTIDRAPRVNLCYICANVITSCSPYQCRVIQNERCDANPPDTPLGWSGYARLGSCTVTFSSHFQNRRGSHSRFYSVISPSLFLLPHRLYSRPECTNCSVGMGTRNRNLPWSRPIVATPQYRFTRAALLADYGQLVVCYV